MCPPPPPGPFVAWGSRCSDGPEAPQLLPLMNVWISVDLGPLRTGASARAVAIFLRVCVLRVCVFGGGGDQMALGALEVPERR